MIRITSSWALALFLFILPWQTQWIFSEATIGGDAVQYGRVALYAIDLAAIAVIVRLLYTRKGTSWKMLFKPRIIQLLTVMLASLVGWSLISTLWAVEPTVALWGTWHLALAAALCFAIVAESSSDVAPLMFAIMFGAITPAALGWIQALMQAIEPSTLLGIAAQDPLVAGTAVIEHAGGRWLRAYGSFPHPNMFGGFTAVGLVAAYIVAGLARSRRVQWLSWISVAVMTGGLLLSASRAAWLAAALGVGLWTAGVMTKRVKALIASVRFPLLISAVVLTVLGLSLYPVLFSRFDVENRLEAKSLDERQAQWVEATDVLAVPTVWFRGTGMGNQPFALARLKPLRPAWAYQPIHNVPMLILLELGVVGLALVGVLILMSDIMVHLTWRSIPSLMAMSLGLAVLVLALFDHYLWTQPSGLYLLAVFLGFNMRAGMLASAIATEAGNGGSRGL